MKSILRILSFSLVVVVIAGGLIWGFFAGRGEQAAEAQRDSPVQAPSRVTSENGHAVLAFDAAAQKANGIVTAILPASQRQIESQATGVVVQLQPLLDLKASYNTPATDLIRARANALASEAEYERLRQLNQNGKNASDKAVEAARATVESDAALVQNAQQAIAVLQASALLHWGPVVSRWLEGNSPRLDALLMQRRFLLQVTGTTATRFSTPKQAIVQFADGTRAQANFVSLLPQLDPRLQVPSLLYEVAAHRGLVPGINLNVFLPSGPRKSGVVVPFGSVVWTQGNAWCYVEESPGKFVRTAVMTSNPVSNGWFMSEGIGPNARVVTSGAQTLLSEEFRSQIQADQD
ncbi:MAG: efflux RND transporter periplasmic adaptor subunit [Acidobacteriaceae bacterium]